MKTTEAKYLPIESLLPFEGHPFQVRDDDEMDRLVWSILTQGLLTPLTVRPLEGGKYEVISGHRRLHACQRAGITEIPALVCDLDRDAAAIAVVDSNLHREYLLPSEKAFAYKMKMDALSHQGMRTDLTLSQVATKLDTATRVGSCYRESRDKVFRYIRLTHLTPTLLQMVDEGKIALTPAVELSYLTQSEQQNLVDAMTENDCTPSLSQAQQMKQLSKLKALTPSKMKYLLSQLKANQKEKISFPIEQLRKYFPKNYSPLKIQETILSLLRNYQKTHKNDISR